MKTREIKFRIWSNSMKRWLCEDSQYLQMDGKKVHAAPWSTMEWNIPSDDDEYVIQQFTGLYDKNKKPIYEGDIIRGMFNMGPAGEVFQTAPVEWNSVNGYQWNYWNLDTVEIIGNIFESRELLKQ
jgi:uncharacterized phage protein (TIGR01671 family)